MKAVVKARREPGLWLEHVPVPAVAGDDVLIRVLKASICGTDVHIYNWDDWAQKTIPVPMTIGHALSVEEGVIRRCPTNIFTDTGIKTLQWPRPIRQLRPFTRIPPK